jgi:hypothetical protein
LQIPRTYADFFSLLCPVLHRIAFPVVSGWYQKANGGWGKVVPEARGLRLAGSFANQI